MDELPEHARWRNAGSGSPARPASPACRMRPLLKGEERQRPLNGGRDRPQARSSAQAPWTGFEIHRLNASPTVRASAPDTTWKIIFLQCEEAEASTVRTETVSKVEFAIQASATYADAK